MAKTTKANKLTRSASKNDALASAYGGRTGRTTEVTEANDDPGDVQQFGMLTGDQQHQTANPVQQRLAEMQRTAKFKAVNAASDLAECVGSGRHVEQLLIPGLYFGHRPGDTRWSLVIQIEGVAPFFTMVVFDRDSGVSARVVNPDPANYLLGPKIDVPGFALTHAEL